MNYLAHLYLARHTPLAMVGGLLGDFAKPAQLAELDPIVQYEVRLHWRIDAYTDSHPIVAEARTGFSEGRRRFAGIVLDVFYDHLLAKHWSTYCSEPLPSFAQQCYAALLAHRSALPDKVLPLVERMAQQDWLTSYKERSNVDVAVRRIALRLSRGGDSLVAALDDLGRLDADLEQGFHTFFPQLEAYVAAQRAGTPDAAGQTDG
jgi:acyl carrier protein phosphodiesterase